MEVKSITADDLLRYLVRCGWKERGRKRGGHRRLYCPCGDHIATLPTSGSDWRGMRNNVARIRRDGCEYIPEEIAR